MIREQGAELTFKNWTETDVCLPLRSQDVILRILSMGFLQEIHCLLKAKWKRRTNLTPQLRPLSDPLTCSPTAWPSIILTSLAALGSSCSLCSLCQYSSLGREFPFTRFAQHTEPGRISGNTYKQITTVFLRADLHCFWQYLTQPASKHLPWTRNMKNLSRTTPRGHLVP